MRAAIAPVIGILAILAAGTALPAQAPSAARGAIGGVVLTEDGGKPIRLASIVVIGAITGTLRVTSTDGSGKFLVADLPADRYLVGASRLPYLGTMAGARRPARPGAPISLADGQKLTDVTIRMPMGAAIAGTLTDDRGLPGANISVTLQRWRTQNGERTLTAVPGGNAATDERGRYRIYGLPPGEYVLSARYVGLGQQGTRVLTDAMVDEAIKTGRGAAPRPADPATRNATVFFPGTSRMNEALPIVLAAGDERLGVDFRLDLVPTSRVEGVVTTADGQPAPGGRVFLGMNIGGAAMSMTLATVAADGRFAFPTVAPGSYTLMSQGAPTPLSAGASAPLSASAMQFASSLIDVSGADLSVQLTLRPALTIPATLAFAGNTPAPALAGRRIPFRILTPLPGVPAVGGMGAPQIDPTNAAGAFRIVGAAPGRYTIGGPLFFGANEDSMRWSIQSVVVDGRDLTDLPIDIGADAAPKQIVITYGDRWQDVSGRLTRASGEAVTDYTILVFPADKAYWMSQSRRIQTARPGSDGRFVLGGQGPATLPPGQYLLAAVSDIDRDEQYDPAFLASIVPAALPVTLQSGERKIQDLVIR